MKTTLLKIAAVAAGVTIALCIAAGSVFWYASRPKPPKQWDTKAIVSVEPTAGFSATRDNDYKMEFGYKLKNTTSVDYSMDDSKPFKVVVLQDDSVLSEPVPTDFIKISSPIFIPSQQICGRRHPHQNPYSI